ncbi:MAG: hypothetical protein HF311_17155 [Ignavibacteria bacterium]|jgi:hypothetical protein|nr:hypothetical protein [Ignavibacteria bacterium]
MDKSPSTVIAPFVGFHFLKQTDTNPFALSAQFQFNVHRITSKDESGQTSLGSWALGGSVFHRFVISNEFSFQPFVTGGMIKPERPTGEPSPGMSAFFDLSGAFIVQKKTRQMILKPSVSISNDETVYSLSFLFVDLI